jgi:hypothetical protein
VYRSSGRMGYGTTASSFESLFDRFEAVLRPLDRLSIALAFGELLADFVPFPFFLASMA